MGEQYKWESSAGGSFTIAKDEKDYGIGRGTRIILHLKEDMLDFLEERKLKDLVKKHSEKAEDDDDDDEAPKVEDVTDKPDKKKKTKKVKQVTHEWEVLNKQKPIWLRKK